MTVYEWIASILGGAALLGGAGTVIWKAAQFVYRARETEKLYHAEREARSEDQKRVEKLLKEAAESAEVLVDGSFLFVKHDPHPMFPLCPVCFADDKRIRMVRAGLINPVTVSALKEYESLGIEVDKLQVLLNSRKGFCCSRCGTHIFIANEEEERALLEKYGVTL